MSLTRIYDSAFLATLQPEKSDAHAFLHAVYIEPQGREDWAERQIARLDECYELAVQHDLVDDDFIRRLRSPSPEQFWGKVNELTAARHFANAGLNLTFNPPGRNERVGEFLVGFSVPTFVEVKTLFPRPDTEEAAQALAILCDEIGKIDAPLWATIQIESPPKQSFKWKPFREYVSDAIADAGGHPSGTIVYSDLVSGLTASVTFTGTLTEGPMESSPMIGPVTIQNDDFIRRTVRKATSQLPKDQPCICVIFEELAFPAKPKHFLNALYGKLSVLIGAPGTKPLITRLQDGLLRPDRHTRLTAIGYFDTPGERHHPDPELQVYHHPEPRLPISAEELSIVSRKQVVANVSYVNGAVQWQLTQPYDDFLDD